MRLYRLACCAGVLTCLTPTIALAHGPELHLSSDGLHQSAEAPKANDHAPIGVMGDHTHKAGEWMLSYRYMHMNMEGNRKGTSELDATTIATTESNRFFGMAGQPATLRVVPTEMDMDMHMLGAMYAPTNWLTLMAMANYLEKDMNHTTFMGGSGTTVLGTFRTESEGWGDTKLSGLVRLYEDSTHHIHLNAGVSLPTGSIDETAVVLAPTGARPRLRMPYAMQLGTGTYDFLPGITYTGQTGDWGWGAQYAAEIRLEDENSEGYAWGDKHSATAWVSYNWADWVSGSARLTGTTQDSISGIDAQIVAPVQTADPDNYGGETVELGLGLNFLGTEGLICGQRLAFEVNLPLYRNLNGPQLENDYTFTVGWQYAF